MATSLIIDQISTTSVFYLLDRMIPLLANGPYSPSTLSQLASLCTGLKAVGPLLDITYKDKMDIIQTLLTKICQDSQLELVLRLQVLEVIELRTLGWESNEVVDNYYQERFTQFEESRKEKERREAKAVKSKDGGDKKRNLSQTPSMISVQEQNNKDKQFVTVNGEKIFLSSSNPELAADAKKLLVDHFSSQSTLTVPSATSNMKYSRTDLLTLATSPLAREAPLNWERLVKTLPSVIQRSPVSNMMVGGGDSNPDLSGSKQKISAIPDSLPLMRNLGM